jgi:hypothetical protein
MINNYRHRLDGIRIALTKNKTITPQIRQRLEDDERYYAGQVKWGAARIIETSG